MPVLPNPRHEAFAQALAKGKTADEAYAQAGYAPILAALGIPKIIISTVDPSGTAAENTLWLKVPA